MFLGQYHHSLDSKDRLTVPSRFREALEKTFFITMGFDKNLLVLPEANFAVLSQSLQDKSLTNPLTRDLRRLIFANAFPVEVDAAGRILIPKHLRDLVGISNEVVLVGQDDYIEVWSPDEWSKRMQMMQDEAIAERFATLEIATRHVTPTSTLQ
jgi:MraZ protein